MISAFDTTVTLFNRIGEDENGSALFSKTVIDRVRVSSRLRSSGGADLDPKSTSFLYFSLSKSKARDKKTYVSPSEWKNCDKATSFTFTNAGDCIAIGENGPVLIEGNEYSGVFQMKPSLSGKKEGLLKKYRAHMDI